MRGAPRSSSSGPLSSFGRSVPPARPSRASPNLVTWVPMSTPTPQAVHVVGRQAQVVAIEVERDPARLGVRLDEQVVRGRQRLVPAGAQRLLWPSRRSVRHSAPRLLSQVRRKLAAMSKSAVALEVVAEAHAEAHVARPPGLLDRVDRRGCAGRPPGRCGSRRARSRRCRTGAACRGRAPAGCTGTPGCVSISVFSTSGLTRFISAKRISSTGRVSGSTGWVRRCSNAA